MKKLLILLLPLLLLLKLNAQNQASNWYFGDNAGLNFNTDTGAVTPLNNSALGTVEGCTTISNPDGDLLFYTDGSTVYNANHVPMQNGLGLLGDESSTQSAIVVPKPNDPEIYYIFTVGSSQNPVGLHYSEVNMSLDDGLGAITDIKNSNLLRGCAEKISAVLKDCESETIWLIAFSNNTGSNSFFMNSFHAFEVSNTGVNINAVVSTLDFDVIDSRGNLKISPNGEKLACANSGGGLFIADFDKQTGMASNAITLAITGTSSSRSYSVEFSPNNELLYVTASNDFFGIGSEDPANHSSTLLQYNLNAPDISASQIILDDRQLYRGSLQLGPNGKIYRALSFTYDQGSPFLGVINAPNVIGVNCNYEHDGLFLGGNLSRQGLPPFIQSFFTEKIDIIQDGTNTLNLSLCDGESYILTAEEITDAIYTWTLNGVTLPETDYDLEIFENGNYQVLIEIENATECRSIEGQAIVSYLDNPEALNATLKQCDEDDLLDGLTVFNLTEANISLTGDIAGLVTKFYASQIDAENDINEILNVTAYDNNSNPETLYVRVINEETECFDISTLLLEVNYIQIEGDANTVYYCLNNYPETIPIESNLIVEPNNTYSYLWSTGETTPTIQVNEIDSYTVTITDENNGCTNTNTIIVEPSNIATINDIIIADGALENNTVTIQASGEGNYVYALFNEEGLAIYPYQESNTFSNVFPGIYTVAVRDIKNDCGIVESTISVVGFPKFFTPNGDGSNDTWSVYGINNEFQPNTIIYILDRYGKLLKQISPLSKGWDGTYNGNPLPSSDYWFYVTLQDERIFKGHFSLKR